jgi:glycosyltransferase involved in cell wall biosynthesis
MRFPPCVIFMPLVSVIIPTFNRAHLLCRALRSVLCQTAGDFEIIVVDDASEDGTEGIDIFSGPLRVPLRFVRLDAHRGVAGARNRGVAVSQGQWLAFLDSDDEWHPDKLARQAGWHETNPAYRISQTKEIWVRNGRRVNPPLTHEKKQGYIFEQSLKRCMITPSSVMMQRSLFDEAGGFNESLPACEDFDLWLKITRALPVGLIDEFLLTRYGGHRDQLSASVMGLDRFRIRSIIDLVNSRTLSLEQEILSRKELVRKSIIVAQGFRKRGRTGEYERYRRIAADFGSSIRPGGSGSGS